MSDVRMWVRVNRLARAGDPVPLIAAGRAWMENSTYTLPPAIARQLLIQGTFTSIGTAPAPTRDLDCIPCTEKRNREREKLKGLTNG